MDPVFFFKFEPRFIQNLPSKTFKNHMKMIQNLHQIVAKMVQNRGLAGVWGAFGRLWGGSRASPGSKAPVGRFMDACWAALGWFLMRFGRLLGGPWAVLGSSWEVLEASWAPLRRLLGRLGHQVGPSWGILEASWGHLGRIFTLHVIFYL